MVAHTTSNDRSDGHLAATYTLIHSFLISRSHSKAAAAVKKAAKDVVILKDNVRSENASLDEIVKWWKLKQDTAARHHSELESDCDVEITPSGDSKDSSPENALDSRLAFESANAAKSAPMKADKKETEASEAIVHKIKKQKTRKAPKPKDSSSDDSSSDDDDSRPPSDDDSSIGPKAKSPERNDPNTNAKMTAKGKSALMKADKKETEAGEAAVHKQIKKQKTRKVPKPKDSSPDDSSSDDDDSRSPSDDDSSVGPQANSAERKDPTTNAETTAKAKVVISAPMKADKKKTDKRKTRKVPKPKDSSSDDSSSDDDDRHSPSDDDSSVVPEANSAERKESMANTRTRKKTAVSVAVVDPQDATKKRRTSEGGSAVVTVSVTETTEINPIPTFNEKTNVRANGKQPRKSNTPFQRIKAETVDFHDERLKDNAFGARGGAANDYGARANRDLIVTRGDGFRKEKNKKKRGSYHGGEITLKSHSIKFT